MPSKALSQTGDWDVESLKLAESVKSGDLKISKSGAVYFAGHA